MRDIDKIVIHCSAGNIGNTAADIVHFHTGPKDKGCRGWKTPGYHYFVDKDGKVSRLVPEDRISNRVEGHNAHAINICYAGGVDQKTFRIPMDTRTPAQKTALVALIKDVLSRYPGAVVYGHRDFANKSCPSFDAKSEYADL